MDKSSEFGWLIVMFLDLSGFNNNSFFMSGVSHTCGTTNGTSIFGSMIFPLLSAL